MSGEGAHYVAWGQQWGIDPRILVAISGAESSFGRNTQGTYNAWGWMYKGSFWRGFAAGPDADAGGVVMATGWEDGIYWLSHQISSYRAAGLMTVAQIGPVYCTSGTQAWLANVRAFMAEQGADCNDVSWPGATSNTRASTGTGFYYPTSTASPSVFPKAFFGATPADGYFSQRWHCAVDIRAAVGDPVFAVADGVVDYVSTGGWGTGNVGLVVRHQLADGRWFLAVYGHITDNVTGSVTAGQAIGRVGFWDNGIHLHFGVYESADGSGARPAIDTAAGNGWGMRAMPRPAGATIDGVLSYDRWMDPLACIRQRSPAGHGSGGNPPHIANWQIDRRLVKDGKVRIWVLVDDRDGSNTVHHIALLLHDDTNNGGKPVQVAEVWDKNEVSFEVNASDAAAWWTGHYHTSVAATDRDGNRLYEERTQEYFVIDRAAPHVANWTIDRRLACDGKIRIWTQIDDVAGSEQVHHIALLLYDDTNNGGKPVQVAEVWDKNEVSFEVNASDPAAWWTGHYHTGVEASDRLGNVLRVERPNEYFVIDRAAPHVANWTIDRRLARDGKIRIWTQIDDVAGADQVHHIALLLYNDTNSGGAPVQVAESWDSNEVSFEVNVDDAEAWKDGRYHTGVEASDRLGNVLRAERPNECFVIDRRPPSLVHVTPKTSSVATGEPIEVTYRFEDPNWTQATLWLKGAVDESAKVVNTASEGTVRLSTEGLRGSRYEVLAQGEDEAGNTSAAPYSTGVFVSIGVSITLPAGLHCLSLPTKLERPEAGTVLGSGSWQLARYDTAAGRYERCQAGQPAAEAFSFLPGRALWLWLTAPQSFVVGGEPVPNDAFDLELARGWNNLGNPYGSEMLWDMARFRVLVAGQDVGALSDTSTWTRLNPCCWVYDSATGGYQLVYDGSIVGSVTSVPRMAGLWIWSDQDHVALRVVPSSGRPNRQRPAAAPQDWSTCLYLAGRSRQMAYIGVATNLRSALEIAVPPRPDTGSGPRLSLVSGDTQRLLCGQVRAASDKLEWSLLVTSSGTGVQTLSWPGLLRDLPRGLLLELTDAQSGQTTLLNTHSHYGYTPGRAGEERQFRLVGRFGNLARSAIVSLSVDAQRGRGAAARLVLSGAADLSVVVRGLGGGLVRVLSGRAEAAGTATLAWDGRDQNGRPVPPGSYLVEALAQSADGSLSRVTRTVTVR